MAEDEGKTHRSCLGEDAWYVTDPSSLVTGVTWIPSVFLAVETKESANLRYDT